MIAHTPKEMVNIEMMMQSLEGYFSIISELLELEPAQFPNANWSQKQFIASYKTLFDLYFKRYYIFDRKFGIKVRTYAEN